MVKNFLYLMKTHFAALFAVIVAFFAPIAPLLLTVGLFILGDTVLGIYRAKKKKEKITSRKLSNIISKMVLYQGAVLLFFMLEKFILDEFIMMFINIPLFLTKIVAATLCVIEIKSMDESFISIYGFSVWDRFKGFLKRAKSTKTDIEDLTK